MVPAHNPTVERKHNIQKLMLLNSEREMLQTALRDVPSPYRDIEGTLAFIYPTFAQLPQPMLKRLLAFRHDPRDRGVLLLSNFPGDENLPATPMHYGRSEKATFISEACALGIAQLLGEPLGYKGERDGEVVHNLCPVPSEAVATSSASSQIDLGFHTDFSFDEERPEDPFDVLNPDYIVLVCLRSDREQQARTMYIDARDIVAHLTKQELRSLQSPMFEFAASYSFTGKCEAERIWSAPTAILKGPEDLPQLSVDMLCGVRGTCDEARCALVRLQAICNSSSDLVSWACLVPGDILVMDNRKGAHGRSAFPVRFDGYDRWVQRVYSRRSLWELRKSSNTSVRVF